MFSFFLKKKPEFFFQKYFTLAKKNLFLQPEGKKTFQIDKPFTKEFTISHPESCWRCRPTFQGGSLLACPIRVVRDTVWYCPTCHVTVSPRWGLGLALAQGPQPDRNSHAPFRRPPPPDEIAAAFRACLKPLYLHAGVAGQPAVLMLPRLQDAALPLPGGRPWLSEAGRNDPLGAACVCLFVCLSFRAIRNI